MQGTSLEVPAIESRRVDWMGVSGKMKMCG